MGVVVQRGRCARVIECVLSKMWSKQRWRSFLLAFSFRARTTVSREATPLSEIISLFDVDRRLIGLPAVSEFLQLGRFPRLLPFAHVEWAGFGSPY